MVPANARNKARLRELVDLDTEAKNKANFEKAFIEAFDLLKQSKYIKVLSRPLVINRDNIAIWTSVYLDRFSTLNISEGLKFMTTVAAPVFDTKNETGWKSIRSCWNRCTHERNYKLAPTYQGDIIINPDYSNMDILDIMLATNKKELEWLKERMLTENNFRGDLDIELLVHYDKMRRMAKRKYSVYYRKILGTAFRIAIALPSTSSFKVDVGKHDDLKNCLNSSGFELAPWKYCIETHENMTSREKIYLILEHSKKSRDMLSKICDTGLLDLLKHDNQMTLNIEQKWMNMANRFPARNMLSDERLDKEPWTSYGTELVFVGTKGGLTKYLNVQNMISENYIKHRTNTIKADYYRRAVEGVEGMDNQPEYKITFSIPLKKEVDVNTTMVTASIPVVIQDGQRKKGIRAVAGPQMKYENLKIDSWTVSQISVNCFLLDNHGYVMASKNPENDLGKFFGDVDGQVMTYLFFFHKLFVGYNFTDHQAICDIKSSDRKKSSASFILNVHRQMQTVNSRNPPTMRMTT